MSRRTQLTTKFIFQITAQLSENFIFIYLGLTLFTETDLEFKPLFIIVTTLGICAARWLAVFPLSRAINGVIRLRAKRRGQTEVADELPYNYQAMLYWAGLRGAVGVALAAGLQGANGPALRATVLVVVVLTVIIFGGTTGHMLEVLGIRTGVVEEIESDDEFDIETANGGTYYKRNGGIGFGHTPRNPSGAVALDYVEHDGGGANGSAKAGRPGRLGSKSAPRGYSSSNRHSPPIRAGSNSSGASQRKNSKGGTSITQRQREEEGQRGSLLNGGSASTSDLLSSDDEEALDLDLPPEAPRRHASPLPPSADRSRSAASALPPTPDPHSFALDTDETHHDGDMGTTSHASAGLGGTVRHIAAGARDLLRNAAHGDARWFEQLDENVIKPTLLLDQHQGQGRGHGRGPSMGGDGRES
jgi:solute carrier family 9 (sodium/hydrogen exchanger), member 6/7